MKGFPIRGFPCVRAIISVNLREMRRFYAMEFRLFIPHCEGLGSVV